MEKSLFERMGGTYKQVGDYLLPGLILSGQEQQSIGIWGQRHARYLKQYHRVRYYNLLTSGKLNSYLACGFVNDVLQNQKTSPRLIKALM